MEFSKNGFIQWSFEKWGYMAFKLGIEVEMGKRCMNCFSVAYYIVSEIFEENYNRAEQNVKNQDFTDILFR